MCGLPEGILLAPVIKQDIEVDELLLRANKDLFMFRQVAGQQGLLR